MPSWIDHPANWAHGFRVFYENVDIAPWVADVHYQDNAVMADLIEVTLLNTEDPQIHWPPYSIPRGPYLPPVVVSQGYRPDILKKGGEIRLELWNGLGYQREVARGVVARSGWQADSEGFPTTVVRAYDRSVDMMHDKKFASFRQVRPTAIVRQIANAHGMQVSFGRNGARGVDGQAESDGDFSEFHNKVQAAKSDWALLSEMARELGCVCWVDYQTWAQSWDETVANKWTLHFHPIEYQLPPSMLLSGWPAIFSFSSGDLSDIERVRVDLVQTAVHESIKLVGFDWALGSSQSASPPSTEYGQGQRVLTDDKFYSYEEWMAPRAKAEKAVEQRTYVRARVQLPFGAPVRRNFAYWLENLRPQFGYDYSGFYWFESIDYVWSTRTLLGTGFMMDVPGAGVPQ